MKKTYFLSLFFVSVLIVTGCGQTPTGPNTEVNVGSTTVATYILATTAPEYAEREWLKLNKDVSNKLESGDEIPLRIEEYATDLVPILTNGGKITSYPYENEKYRLTSVFKGSLVGYDKERQRSFVLYVPSTIYDWVQEVQFSDEDTVELSDENNYYLLSLKNRTIQKENTGEEGAQ